MSVVLARAEADRAAVIEWVSNSLARGADVSKALLLRLEQLPVGFLVIPDHPDLPTPWIVDDRPYFTPPTGSPRTDFFHRAHAARLSTLVFEDDLRHEGDPNLIARTVFGIERPLHWSELGNPASAEYDANHGASGYPFNGFLTDMPPDELGLRGGRRITASEIALLAGSARVILASAFDNDAYAGLATPSIWAALDLAATPQTFQDS